MKKISILSLHLGYGGIEKSVVALANILCEKYKVEIVCIYQLYKKPAFEIDPRVKVKYLIRSNLPKKVEEYKLLFFHFHWLKLFKKLFSDYFKKFKFVSFFKDAVGGISMYSKRAKYMKNYIKNSSSEVMISTRTFLNEWVGLYAKENVLKIGWEHNHHHNNKKYAIDVVHSAKYLDYFVLVSQSLKDFYELELKKTKCQCVFIPNMIENLPKRAAPLENKKLISVGRLSEEKGYIDLLRVYYLLLKEHSDWTLDIIGDGPERGNLENYIKRHQLESKVTLHGFRDKQYIDRMLHNASIYVMTSHTESFGIVLIEAMSHGVPCVAFSSAEGARELIQSGENGYLIKNRNYAAFVKKIEDLMERVEERKRIGKASRIFAKKYTSDVVKEQWFDLIEKK